MKFALGEIRQMKEPMANLLTKELPLKASWRLNKLVKSFDKELIEIENARVSLVKKYGEADAEGHLRVPESAMQEFINELNTFLCEEVEIEFEPIAVDTLGDINCSAKDLMLMEKLFV